MARSNAKRQLRIARDGLRADTRAYVAHLILEGHAETSGTEVSGRAADGVWVRLGSTADHGIDALGSYLRKFPYPTQW